MSTMPDLVASATSVAEVFRRLQALGLEPDRVVALPLGAHLKDVGFVHAQWPAPGTPLSPTTRPVIELRLDGLAEGLPTGVAGATDSAATWVYRLLTARLLSRVHEVILRRFEAAHPWVTPEAAQAAATLLGIRESDPEVLARWLKALPHLVPWIGTPAGLRLAIRLIAGLRCDVHLGAAQLEVPVRDRLQLGRPLNGTETPQHPDSPDVFSGPRGRRLGPTVDTPGTHLGVTLHLDLAQLAEHHTPAGRNRLEALTHAFGPLGAQVTFSVHLVAPAPAGRVFLSARRPSTPGAQA